MKQESGGFWRWCGRLCRPHHLQTSIRNSGRLLVVLGVAWLLAGAAPVQAQSPSPADLNEVRFQPHLNAQVPADLAFRDETGKQVKLGDYLGGKPVILTLNYLHCPNLCPLILDGLERTLSAMDLNLNQDYRVVTVSIDPRETPVLAAVKKQDLLGRYGRAGAEGGWYFLTGAPASIAQLAAAVGFQYMYDARQDEYAHPAGIVILTPQGRISRYLYGMDFPIMDLRLGLVESSENKIGSLGDQLLLVCYHYDPQDGKYVNVAMDFVRWGGVASMLALFAFLITLWKHEAVK